MKILYTDKQYAQKAIEANTLGQMLYILVTDKEYEVDIPDVDEDGEFIIIEEEIQQPVIVEETGEPVLDEDGNPIMQTVVVEKYQTHKETRTEQTKDLVIAPVGYYVCFLDNMTDGTLNTSYEAQQLEEAKAAKLAQNATALEKKDSLTTSLGVIKIQTPIGKIDVVVTSMLNLVQITQQPLPAGFLRTYVDGVETPSPEMTLEQVGAFYLEIAQKIKAMDTLYKRYEAAINAAESAEALEAITLDYSAI